ncbi:MAG: hypothetical protein IPO72_20015 [Saprospiraceae bacterium]|nr:hypothetical protein [Candidatus Vicinibacter affinis]
MKLRFTLDTWYPLQFPNDAGAVAVNTVPPVQATPGEPPPLKLVWGTTPHPPVPE